MKIGKSLSADQLERSHSLQNLFWLLLGLLLLKVQTYFFVPVGVASPFSSCPEYFQSCSSLQIFAAPGEGWGYRLFLVFFALTILGSGFFAFRKQWSQALAMLIVPFAIEAMLTLALSADTQISYTTYLLGALCLVLFSRRKLSDLRWLYALIYFVIGIQKLNEGWLAGTLFTNFALGLPLIPQTLIPLASLGVVFIETCACWWLLDRSPKVRWIAVGLFAAFHVYSVSLIGSLFLFYALLPLVFVNTPDDTGLTPLKRPSRLAGALFALIIAANFAPFFYSGDIRATSEGTSLAIRLFDATRQVSANATIHNRDGTSYRDSSLEQNFEFFKAYRKLGDLKRRCSDPLVERIEWIVDISVNGEPFQRLIEAQNACTLEYSAFAHNAWLESEPKTVGYPGPREARGAELSKTPPRVFDKPQFQKSALTEALQSVTRLLQILVLISSLISAGLVLRRQWNE